MTRAELTEAMARAIYEADHKGLRNCWHWDNAGLDVEHPGSRERYLARATAALAVVAEAMRAPSEKMEDGAEHITGFPREVWRAMLAASPLAEAKQ